MPQKVMILAQFDHRYYIRGTLKWLMDVLISPKASWICEIHAPHCIAGEEIPPKVMVLAQFDHGYYIRGTLKRLTDVVAWLKAWWIRLGHGYYIRGILKRLMGVLACLKVWWIRVEEMPPKVMILAQFDHGYYIRGTLKRLTDVVAWLKAWWIRLGHGYYIRGTLKRLMVVLAWRKAWWICVGVKQVTDLKSMPPLPQWRGNVCKSCDFGSVWPWILYPWDFAEADRCGGMAPGLVDLCECETSHRPEIHATVASLGRKSCDSGSVSPQILYLWDFEVADRCFGLAQGFMDQRS
ncbi:hypothetical protein C8R44DRAFT_731369 [Mycena epipterygia]|nr:hypothetical protein C8R44DRAFT_731369 [Mycena epipterygia]